MKRRTREDVPTTNDQDFWPIPGVDGVPYPEDVQAALDLVAAETKRRLQLHCEHPRRRSEMRLLRDYQRRHVCMCDVCDLEVPCIPTQYWECREHPVRARRGWSGIRTRAYGFPYEAAEESGRQTQSARPYLKPVGVDYLYAYERRRVDELRAEADRLTIRAEGELARNIRAVYNANGEMVLTWSDPDPFY